jgi:hypothetical protein
VRRAAIACLLALASAESALASSDQESILQDDPLIVYPSSESELERTLATIKELGVDRVRVSVFWNLVAPRPKSRRRPSFAPRGAAWPGSYPRRAWRRYDNIVRLARRLDLGVLFTITGPAPNWAAGRNGREYSVYKPKPRELKAFTMAVGQRYSGNWPPRSASPESGADLPSVPFARARRAQQQDGTALPRVSHWSIWNEANFPSWLSPQSRRSRLAGHRGRLVPYSPHLYRRLVDAAWEGLEETGHTGDVILLGETAPRGGQLGVNKTIPPVKFLRELYCLDRYYLPFTGSQARDRGCPETSEEIDSFTTDHPALFQASGWAHHPYSIDRVPTWRHPSLNSAPLGSIDLLIAAYDNARLGWDDFGQADIWITEYGYQTRPDPYVSIPFARQAKWLSWAEFLAYLNPRVASMAQFLLNDDKPHTKFPADDIRRWRTWQSGLATQTGKRKPAFKEYPFAIHVTPTRIEPGGQIRLFGVARPAENGTPLIARIRMERTNGEVETLASVQVTNSRAYLDVSVDPEGPGELYILWVDPSSGGSASTRRVPITIR